MPYMKSSTSVDWEGLSKDLNEIIKAMKRHGYGREEMIATQRLEEAYFWLGEASKTRK